MQRIAVARAAAALQTGHPGLALEAVDRAEERMGRRSDFEYLRGCALEALALGAPQGSRRRELAARAAEAHAAALRPDASGVAEQIVHQAGTAVNLCRLGCALLVAGRAAEARAAFDRALDAMPGLEEARLGVAEARLEAGDAGGALAEIEPLLGATPDGWALAAAAAGRLGARKEAALFAERASERAAMGFMSPHRRAFVDEARAADGEAPCRA